MIVHGLKGEAENHLQDIDEAATDEDVESLEEWWEVTTPDEDFLWYFSNVMPQGPRDRASAFAGCDWNAAGVNASWLMW